MSSSKRNSKELISSNKPTFYLDDRGFAHEGEPPETSKCCLMWRCLLCTWMWEVSLALPSMCSSLDVLAASEAHSLISFLPFAEPFPPFLFLTTTAWMPLEPIPTAVLQLSLSGTPASSSRLLLQLKPRLRSRWRRGRVLWRRWRRV